MKYDINHIPKVPSLVLFKSEVCEVQSIFHPSQTAIIEHPVNGSMTVRIDELSDLSCPFPGCRWTTKKVNDDFCNWHKKLFERWETSNKFWDYLEELF